MNRLDIINLAYREFSEFPKPDHSTDYLHCLECKEYDDLLRNVKCADLTIEQIGTECWGPVAFLLPEAMAYYMPKFIELALLNVDNKAGSPYITQFINQIGLNRSRPCFSLFRCTHISIVGAAFRHIDENYRQIVEYHCWENDLDEALNNWKI
jgi:hypothetical protein